MCVRNCLPSPLQICERTRRMRMSALVVHVFLGLVALLPSCLVDSYSNGAPTSTCWTRYPKHMGLGTQTSPCPIHITFSSATYSPGATITVTIEDPNPSRRWFTGIEMGAFRDTGNQEEIVGQFENYPTDKLKTLTCFGGNKNMITHLNGMAVQKLEVRWKAPSENVGNLTFKATIVANFETFWTQVQEKLPSSVQNAATIKAPQYTEIVSKRMVEDVDLSACGDTKGCFLHPRHCSGDNCLAAVSFQHRPATDDYQFEMYSTTGQNWISVGFSDDLKMGHDETISCVSSSGQISIQHGWNPHYYNERLLTRFLSEAEVRQSDGKLHCRFVLPKETSVYIIDQDSNVLSYTNTMYSRDQEHYLMLAWGKVMPGSDVMTIHKDMPAITYNKVNMKDTSIYRGSSFPLLVRIHAALMMIAWIFLGGIVTVISRHFRDWMPKKRLFGTKVWFQVHRELAILIVILTTIGLIVIFSHYGAGITKYSVPHAYVGLVAAACVGLQVIAGCLRPGLDHKMRFIFNWGHRFLGQTTHILAAVTMFLAYDIGYFHKDLKSFGSAVLSVWVVVQLLWHIAFEILTCRGMPLSSRRKNTDSDNDKGNNNCSLHTILFVIYAVTLAGLTTAALLSFLLF